MLEKTSTDYAPWHVVPCDKKWYSRLAMLELLIEAPEEPQHVVARQPISTSRRRRSGSRTPDLRRDYGFRPGTADSAP